MATQLTLTAQLTAGQLNVQPQLVFSIDGVPTKFGAAAIYEFVRIGQPDLEIDNYLGDPWYIGGYKLIEDQSDYISFAGGTTTRITQQLEPDKGLGTSASGLAVALIDKNDEITNLISPGVGPVTEILGKSCTVQIGFANNAYPEDYVTIFKGLIETVESGPGLIKFFLTSTEQKKRQTLFIPANSKLATAISDVDTPTTIVLDDATDFKVPVLGPDGTYDSTITYWVRINDEYFKYTGKSGNTLTGVTRNSSPLNYTQLNHAIGDDVLSLVRITGTAMDIARKLMISGTNGAYQTALDVESFVYVSPTEQVDNAIFFFGVDVQEEYGFTEGDYLTTTGSAFGANNVSGKQILQIFTTNDGSYIIVDGVTFVAEQNSAATLTIRSQWDSYGYGCKMDPNEVDLPEFDRLDRLFLGGFNYDFRIDNEIEAKKFIEEQILRPVTSFSILRRGRSSVGFHSPPIPGDNIVTVDQNNVENIEAIKIKRSLSKNYYNTVTYKFDKDTLANDFKSVRVIQDATSIDDFNVGQRSISIESQGMRTLTGGTAIASSSGNRFLNRYKRGSEYVDGISVRFGDVYNLDIGDNVILDITDLKISDIVTGTRLGESRIFQVLNKTMDISTGAVSISIVDTNFNGASRYGLVVPASIVKSGSSTTVFVIKSSFASRYGSNEYLKWSRYGTPAVNIKSSDGVTRNGDSRILSIAGNTVTLQTPLSFTPQAGDLMTFTEYNLQDVEESTIYVSMRDSDPFDDGKPLFKMI